MTTLEVGKPVADFTAASTDNPELTLGQFRDQHHVIIYFYPKDNTPGCTTEGNDFKAMHGEFLAHDTVIYGVSKDSLKSHQNFINKFDFPFALISDPDESLCKHFDVIKEKNMYGKKYMGIERSTFLIDKSGTLVQEWRKVRVKEHVAKVLDAVKQL